MGAEDEPLDGRGDTGRGEGGGEAGGAVGGGAGRWRLAGDGSPHHAVLQGGCRVAVAARVGMGVFKVVKVAAWKAAVPVKFGHAGRVTLSL